MGIPTLEEQIHIEEILAEANAWGLKREVQSWANKLMEESPEMALVDAYAIAFDEWVK